MYACLISCLVLRVSLLDPLADLGIYAFDAARHVVSCILLMVQSWQLHWKRDLEATVSDFIFLTQRSVLLECLYFDN